MQNTVKKDKETEVRLAELEVRIGLVEEKNEKDAKIEALIRQEGGYSMSQELAIHRKKMMGILPDEEWDRYCAYVQECIGKVRELNPEE